MRRQGTLHHVWCIMSETPCCTACTLQVRHATIQLDNTAAVDVIHSLQPTSMSWSNVPDYMVLQVRHMPYAAGPAGQDIIIVDGARTGQRLLSSVRHRRLTTRSSST